MKITIDIPDMYVPILSKWASVARTLNSAANICDEFINITDNEYLKDKAFIAKEDLYKIVQPLNNLHQTVRNELWIKHEDG